MISKTKIITASYAGLIAAGALVAGIKEAKEYRVSSITVSEIVISNIPFLKEGFKDSLAMRESSLNPQAVNSFGYVGKYQLGKLAFLDLGYTILEYEHILDRLSSDVSVYPEWKQDLDFASYMDKQEKYLTQSRKYWNGKITDYIALSEGEVINGIKITKSGLLAAAHLCGHRSVKNFIDSNGKKIAKDGNGVPITEYLERFAGYKC